MSQKSNPLSNREHARGSRSPDSGPTPDPLSLCDDDINLIVTCFNAVFKIVLKRIFNTLLPTFAVWFDIWNQIDAVNNHTDTQLKN